MKIIEAKFIISNTDPKKCPKPTLPEYAFIGRSNVGKSSLINMLTGRKGLAKISSTPGKTQLINHFSIDDNWFLVDLPGYGYAKISKNSRRKWFSTSMDYFETRSNLMCVFVLVDLRHPPQGNDLEFMQKLTMKQIPFVVVLTKADKVTKNGLPKLVEAYKKKLLETYVELPTMFLSSSEKGTGRDEILDFIEETNKLFEEI